MLVQSAFVGSPLSDYCPIRLEYVFADIFYTTLEEENGAQVIYKSVIIMNH